MKSPQSFLLFFLLLSQITLSQVVLSADGSSDTYKLINSVLAPKKNAIEALDCSHADFGKHIDQVFDKELNKNVFRFHIHLDSDGDRCNKNDKQRNEIKTDLSSPENLKGILGETIEYKWKFKLDDTFKPSKSFTHIHQIKSVGGPYASVPMISLTLRKGTPDKLELRYTSTKRQITLKKENLDKFKGQWVEVTELISFYDVGTYSIKIKRISDNKEIFNYSNAFIDTWQNGAEFIKPKWGIYRSLKNKQDLKDEIIKYADFSIEEKKEKEEEEETKEEIVENKKPIKEIDDTLYTNNPLEKKQKNTELLFFPTDSLNTNQIYLQTGFNSAFFNDYVNNLGANTLDETYSKPKTPFFEGGYKLNLYKNNVRLNIGANYSTYKVNTAFLSGNIKIPLSYDLSYFALKIGFDATLIKWRKLSTKIQLHLSNDWLTAGTSSYNNIVFDLHKEKTLDPTLLRYHTGISFEYEVSKKMSAYLNYNIGTGLQSTIKDSNNNGEKYSFGTTSLSVGLILNILKNK